MIHPDTELRFIDPEVGHGVFATAALPRGTVTWVRDRFDAEWHPAAIQAVPDKLRDAVLKYCYRTSRGHYFLCWDHARYVNHSFRPNCFPTPYGFEIAVRDILPGDELTNDYGILNILEPFRPRTETDASSRSTVHPDDTRRHHEEWDRAILTALRDLPGHPQPLRELIAPETWRTVLAVSSGRTEPESVLRLLLDVTGAEEPGG